MRQAENDGIVHTIVSLTPKRNEANGVKEPKHIQESIKVIKADSLILLYTYFSKCYIPNTLCPFLMPINQFCLALFFDRSRNKKKILSAFSKPFYQILNLLGKG